MQILGTVIGSALLMVGVVLFYQIYNQFSANLGSSGSLLLLVPVIMIFGGIIQTLVSAFSSGGEHGY
jgi:hypothetical protein